MTAILKSDLYRWCCVPARDLSSHPQLKVRFRMVRDSTEMGQLMAEELASLIESKNAAGFSTRAIIPCGPKCWYEPFTKVVNARRISLRNLSVFHMDECLDWQGQPLPVHHPYNFRTFMEKHFYGGIDPELAVPESQRFWLLPSTAEQVRVAIEKAPIDLTLGGWDKTGTSPTTRRDVILTAQSRLRNLPDQRSGFRRTTSTPYGHWRSGRSGRPTSLFPPCRSRLGSRNASLPNRYEYSATQAPGSKQHFGWHSSLSRHRNTR